MGAKTHGTPGNHECQEAPGSSWIEYVIIMQFMRSSKLNLLANARYLNRRLSKLASLIAASNTLVEVQKEQSCQDSDIRCRANTGCRLKMCLSQPAQCGSDHQRGWLELSKHNISGCTITTGHSFRLLHPHLLSSGEE